MWTPSRSMNPSSSGYRARVCSLTGSDPVSTGCSTRASGPRTVTICPAPERVDDPPAVRRLDQVEEVHVLVREHVDARDAGAELGDPDVEPIARPGTPDPGSRGLDHLLGGRLVELGRVVGALGERSL